MCIWFQIKKITTLFCLLITVTHALDYNLVHCQFKYVLQLLMITKNYILRLAFNENCSERFPLQWRLWRDDLVARRPHRPSLLAGSQISERAFKCRVFKYICASATSCSRIHGCPTCLYNRGILQSPKPQRTTI